MRRTANKSLALAAFFGAAISLGAGGPVEPAARDSQPTPAKDGMEATKKDAPETGKPPAKDVPKPAIAWSEAQNGLQLGLSVSKARFAPGEPIPMTIWLRNTGRKPLAFPAGERWHVSFAPSIWSAALAPEGEGRRWPVSEGITLKPGEEKSFPMTIDRKWRFYDDSLNAPDLHPHEGLMPGRYPLSVSSSWLEAPDTGKVEIEIASAGEAKPPEKKDAAASAPAIAWEKVERNLRVLVERRRAGLSWEDLKGGPYLHMILARPGGESAVLWISGDSKLAPSSQEAVRKAATEAGGKSLPSGVGFSARVEIPLAGLEAFLAQVTPLAEVKKGGVSLDTLRSSAPPPPAPDLPPGEGKPPTGKDTMPPPKDGPPAPPKEDGQAP